MMLTVTMESTAMTITTTLDPLSLADAPKTNRELQLREWKPRDLVWRELRHLQEPACGARRTRSQTQSRQPAAGPLRYRLELSVTATRA
jgi:hypothetical protein